MRHLQSQYQCGGCRVFADDFWGADPGCPGPVYPEPPRLGKAGRKLDLKEYCQKHGGISVAQYMERYGVGQERAVRELKDTPGLRNSDPRSTGRRLTAYYGYAASDHELLLDIQESIGFTSGGAPFATLDEIADWVTDEAGDETGHAYPRWILKGRLSDREDY